MDPELLAKQVARSMFQTTAYEYGSRGSLELFGVSQVYCNSSVHASPHVFEHACMNVLAFACE